MLQEGMQRKVQETGHPEEGRVDRPIGLQEDPEVPQGLLCSSICGL
jgi:hypothetical protein